MHAVGELLPCQVVLLLALIYIILLIQLLAKPTARIFNIDLVLPIIFVISVVVITPVLINDLLLFVPLVLLERAILT